MFWPDVPEERARASLRHELWRIRKALAHGPAKDAILADDIAVAFAPKSGYWIDVACLEQVTEDASADQLSEALGAYAGELLPGFYDDWVVAEREHLQLVFEQRAARLLDLLEAEKRWPETIQWAERWLAVGDSPERAYRALMLAHQAMGDRAKVRAAYQRCEQALSALGLEPSDDMRAMLETPPASVSLPAVPTSLIGRQNELREIAGLLQVHRLVTLTGAGGVGKTRLAVEIARSFSERFPDGVWYLELATLRDPALVPDRMLSLLHAQAGSRADEPAIDRIAGHLHGRRALLVLDNCEHLIEACAALVSELLGACPGLQVLATSREILRVPGEMAYRVPSLALPSAEELADPGLLARVDSVRLFAERAQARSHTFALTPENARRVAEICTHLDGIPLAIELAAARISTVPLQAMAEHLNDRFALLAAGPRTDLPRHKTLRAMIDWSYDLLSEAERVLFRRLSVFVGGWTMEAAQMVAGEGVLRGNDVLGLLPGLVDKSLVMLDMGSSRYDMLETIREYALERLKEAAEEERIRTRHLDHFIAATEASLTTAMSSEAAEVQLAADAPNILAAVQWCETAEDGVQKGLQLLSGARLVSALLDQVALGYPLLRRFLSLPGAEQRTHARQRALLCLAEAATFLVRTDGACAAAEESLAIARETGDQQGEAQALRAMGNTAALTGDLDKAMVHFEAAIQLGKQAGFSRLVALAQNDMAEWLRAAGDWSRAEELYEQAVAIQRQIDAPHDLALVGLINLTSVQILRGELEPAYGHLTELLSLMAEMPYGLNLADGALLVCAGYLAAAGDHQHAVTLLGASDRQRELTGLVLQKADQLFAEWISEQSCRALGRTAFEAARAEGHRLCTPNAVARARDWLCRNEPSGPEHERPEGSPASPVIG